MEPFPPEKNSTQHHDEAPTGFKALCLAIGKYFIRLLCSFPNDEAFSHTVVHLNLTARKHREVGPEQVK